MRVAFAVCVATLTFTASAGAQRERMREIPRDRSTVVSDAQASELTLTLTEAAPRPIQIWVRTGGLVDDARRNVTAVLSRAEAERVEALCAWNAFALQVLGNQFVAPYYAANPPAFEHVPPVTAEQAMACYGQVEGWLDRARMNDAARRLLGRVGLDEPPTRIVGELPRGSGSSSRSPGLCRWTPG